MHDADLTPQVTPSLEPLPAAELATPPEVAQPSYELDTPPLDTDVIDDDLAPTGPGSALATGLAILVMGALLVCATIILIAAGNA